MKILISILLVFGSSISQLISQTDFSHVDAHAMAYKVRGKDFEKIAHDLTEPFTTETEKARSIYIWITDNIRYDYKKFMNRSRKKSKVSFNTEEERDEKLAKMSKKNLTKTLSSKKGVCEDYSRLFERLCKEAGIEAIVVHGHSRKDRRHVGKLPRVYDHAWNAVKLEGEWFLVDATWGAGGIDEKGKFHKNLIPGYFKVKPEDLIKSHFPKDEKLQFLSRTIDKKQFSELPLAVSGYYEFGIEEHFPENALIDSEKQDRVEFKFKVSEKPEGDWFILENTRFRKIKTREENGYVVFDFDLKNKKGKVLTIGALKENKMIEMLRYKVK